MRSLYQNRGPIWSPDKRYVWDGEKWLPNGGNNNGFGGGVIVGLLIAGLFLYLWFRAF
jgi:hypothetical protein